MKERQYHRGDPATACIHVRVTETQRRELQQAAREVRLPMTTMIREAVNSFVGDYREGTGPFRSTKRTTDP